MPRRNRNALRGGVRQPRDWDQSVRTVDEFDGLDLAIMKAQQGIVVRLDAATDFSTVLAGICAQATANDGGRK